MSRIFFPRLFRCGNYPVKGDGGNFGYAYYRELIAVECQRRCVYCDAFEDEVGGAEAMQIDHFRPESFPEFEHLRDVPTNLHYACGRCNLLKWSHWPARGTAATHNGQDGFIDPFVEDRLEYFRIRSNGQIEGLRPPSQYIIRLLHLRREFLRKLRERRLLWRELEERVAAIKQRLESDQEARQLSDPAELLELISAFSDVARALR